MNKMKSLNLAVIVSAVALMVSGLASAGDAYNKNVHNQNFSKRPYAQPLPDSAYQKGNEFEGATLVRGEVSEDGNAVDQKQQAQRLNNLSKRPY
jgi:hypothetical protein